MRLEGSRLHSYNDPVLAMKATVFLNLPECEETKANLFIVNKQVFLASRKNPNWLIKPFSLHEVSKIVLPNGNGHKAHGALLLEVSQ